MTEQKQTADEALRRELFALREESNGQLSNGRIARQIGYSAAVISLYLHPEGNRYDGDVKKFEARARQ